jgi:hypothetical protein
MTAEIAILNRVAATLAADSAMTVTGRSEQKVYNSIDKIFELSGYDPIGMMIYNTLDFMGVPLDVLIREFRTSKRCTSVPDISDIAKSFFDFLAVDVGASEEAQEQHVEQTAIDLIEALANEYDQKFTKFVSANPKGPPKGFDPSKITEEVINGLLKPLRRAKADSSFADISPEDIRDRYYKSINKAIDYGILPHAKAFRAELLEFVATFFHRDILSPNLTGLVIAGFGANDRFPQLHPFEIDGIVADRLKKRANTPTKIDRTRVFAEILPFAQRDMADSFLFGIAPEIEHEIPEFLDEIIRGTGRALIKELAGSDQSAIHILNTKLDKAAKKASAEFRNKAMKKEKDRYRQGILQMVRFMPKQELADFAESMVNITSLKRHVSPQQETVAGPIDVAVISKSEGFIWVKRKHYFEPAYNPRYFVRKFGAPVPMVNRSGESQ